MPAAFETKRTLIRPTGLSDASFIHELMNSPTWLQFIGDRNVKTLEDTKQYISSRMLPHFEQHGFGNFLVIRKNDGVVLGTVGLYDRPGLEGIDLGFAFLPQYEGFGYAFESAREMQRAAFEDFNIERLQAITTKENLRSQRLLARLNFQFERFIRLKDDPEELMLLIAQPNSGNKTNATNPTDD